MKILRAFLPLIVLAVLWSSTGTLQAYTLKTLYTFCSLSNCADGARPLSDLVADGSGNLYGTTADGGAHSPNGFDQFGVVFELKRPTKTDGHWRYTTLYSFCAQTNCIDGQYPTAGVILDASGNLYGTTQFGGKYNDGTVFELLPKGKHWKLKTLHHFCGHFCKKADGANPSAGLTYADAAQGFYDGQSPLFGATYAGGDQNSGTVFEITTTVDDKTWKEKVIASFCTPTACTLGENPMATPTLDGNGNLFGTAILGGAHQSGTAYELVPNDRGKWAQIVLHDFSQAEGYEPAASLVLDSAGNLVGTAPAGGSQQWGTVFKLTQNARGARDATVIYDFCSADQCVDGGGPYGRVVFDNSGNLLVLNSLQGLGAGAFVKISPSGQLLDHYDFCSLPNCADGSFPHASVIADQSGNLFGTTANGGPNGGGTVFELVP